MRCRTARFGGASCTHELRPRLALLAVLATSPAWAQDAKKAAPPNPAGRRGPGARPSRRKPPAGEEFDKKQMELIQKVTAYFNQMSEIKGAFMQTSADNKRLRGKFYVKRPGRFRFDYSLPSRLVIMSDGQYMIIQDLDLKTDDRVRLDQTPFRVVLRKDVDLMRDCEDPRGAGGRRRDRAGAAGQEPRHAGPHQAVPGQETRP